MKFSMSEIKTGDLLIWIRTSECMCKWVPLCARLHGYYTTLPTTLTHCIYLLWCTYILYKCECAVVCVTYRFQ